DGGLAPEDGAQEPAGAVHAEEPHRAVARAPLRRADLKTCEELSAEGPGHVVDRPALLRDGLGELGADLVPHALGLGCREGLDLEAGLAERDRSRRDDLRVAVDLHAQLHAVARGQPERAEVDTLADALDLRDVPRSVVAGGRLARRRVGRLVRHGLGLLRATREQTHRTTPSSGRL